MKILYQILFVMGCLISFMILVMMMNIATNYQKRLAEDQVKSVEYPPDPPYPVYAVNDGVIYHEIGGQETFFRTVTTDPKQIKCLARNIYFEGRGEPEKGQRAVAYVTLNRVRSPHFPNTICKVVHQRAQFSWTLNGKYQKAWERDGWLTALRLATDVLSKYELERDPVKDATFYHADYVNPGWARKMTKTAKLGPHIFYQYEGR